MVNAVVDLIDGGTGAGYLEFQTSGGVEVATITFDDPAFPTASSGTAAAAGFDKSDIDATGGTISKFAVYDSGAILIFEGTVTLWNSGGDLELTTLTVDAGDTVIVEEFIYASVA
jgi:hypothetical protein